MKNLTRFLKSFNFASRNWLKKPSYPIADPSRLIPSVCVFPIKTQKQVSKINNLTITCKHLEFFISTQKKHNINLTLHVLFSSSQKTNTNWKQKGAEGKKAEKKNIIFQKIVIPKNYLFSSFDVNNIVFHKYIAMLY